MRSTLLRASVVAVTAVVALGTPGVAFAKDGDVIRTGNCSNRADWKLKLSPENGRVEVEFEVDANQRGQRWRVTLFRSGKRIDRGVYRTHGRSGSFTARDVARNTAGKDRFRARAVRLSGSKQTCRGSARF